MRSRNPIIPGDLVTTPEAFKERLDFAREIGNSIHADVVDGTFVEGDGLAVTDWPQLDIDYSEAHLMVRQPISYLQTVKEKGATRAMVHVESDFELEELSTRARELDLLLGFVVNPETDLSKLVRYIAVSNYIQVMGIHPGKTGQPFLEHTSLAVAYLRRLPHHLVISVDGGVSQQNIKALRTAGANFFIASSSIYDKGDWKENYQSLLTILNDD